MTCTDSRHGCSSDLEKICRRVREKSASYDRYNFSGCYNDFLKAFFDLAQEYDSLEDFYRICVAVPLEMTGLRTALYLVEERDGRLLWLVCDAEHGVYEDRPPAPESIILKGKPYTTETSYVVPIYRKAPADRNGYSGDLDDADGSRQTSFWYGNGIGGHGRILGMFEVRPLAELSDTDKFFFVKYSNRIGYNLHNRLISLQNIEHLKFINNLVIDIEHNIIVPNMYFKHLFNQLRKKIVELESLEEEIRNQAAKDSPARQCERCEQQCSVLKRDLLHYHQELVKHHANISLFLESLFRREHFQRGHLVLRPKRCLVEKEVILPQLEHYASRLRAANITVERPKNMLEEEFQIYVDVGLLSQVYANLFSNAAKYTQEIIDHQGRPRKAMAYGRELVQDYPEPGKQGIKFNVFTTGPHLSEEEAKHLFQEGMRGKNSENVPGSGHGLAFIRHVIELHGGTVGYEPTSEGNNFYFILPVPPMEYPLTLVDPVK